MTPGLALNLCQPIQLIRGNREADDFYDLEDIGSWTRTSPDFHAALAIENNDTPMDAPVGVRTVTGRIDQAIAGLSDMQESDVYLAGAPAMISAASRRWTAPASHGDAFMSTASAVDMQRCPGCKYAQPVPVVLLASSGSGLLSVVRR